MSKNVKDHKFHLACKNMTIKEAGENTLVISGYANTTSKDRVGDVILEQAWVNGGMDNYLKNPIVLAYHDPTRPIGEVVDYGVSNKGLHVIAEISKAAGDVYELIKTGILKAFSVGFVVKDADYDTETDIFVIKDLELYELSVVSIPANADSIFSVAKSFEENEEDYLNFKKLYSKKSEEIVPKEQVTEDVLDTKEENEEMDKDKISLTPEELEAKMAEAVQAKLDSIAAEKAKKEEIARIAVEASTTGAERLVKELEERLLEKDQRLDQALNGLRTELSEKTAEIEAMRNSKMSFKPEERVGQLTKNEINTAVMAAKMMGKKIEETEYFKSLVTKAGVSDHLSAVTADWENLFSTDLYQDIQDKTIIEPLFTNKIQMNSRTMTFPWNPEAGYAEWILEANYKDAATSTGTGAEQDIQDNTIKAEKLATKEYLGYEEEEDSIIALVPIVNAAVVRRMVRSTDTELLRANAGADTGSGNAPTGFNGISTLAADINGGADYQYVQPGAFGDPATIADLQQVRRKMGTPGLMPGGIIYIVSEAVMYDLMEDPDFRTADLVGDRATILRGQIGSVNGSPVVVSDSFISDAASSVQAVAFNAANYLFGTLRGMTLERDKDIEFQRHVLVATRRFGLTEIVPAVAAATKRQSYCTNLVRPA